MQRTLRNACSLCLFLFGFGSAWAQGTFQFSVHPTGGEEVPPNSSINLSVPGSLTLNGTTLSYGFTVAPATGPGWPTDATINGPAGVGVIGPTVFDLGAGQLGYNPPGWVLWHGTITGLTSTQISELVAGLWYVNVFTTDSSFPEGEYRGQITLVPEPSGFCIVPTAFFTAAIMRKCRTRRSQT